MVIHKFLKYLLKNQILLIVVLVALVWFIIQIQDILVAIFLAYIIMASVLPMVRFLQRKGFPKIIAVLIPYFLIIVAVFLLVFPLVPFVVEQLQSLATQLPKFWDATAKSLGFSVDQHQLQTYINSEANDISKSVVNFTTKFFGGILSTITVFVISFYLLLYHESFEKGIARLFHYDSRGDVLKTIENVNSKLGAWVRGEFILCFIIGLLSWIGLTILGMPYALPLALLAGLLEVVPTLGPILSAIPAAIIGFTISPTYGIAVILLYMLIQGLENQLLVPKIMQHAIGLNPVFVILGVMIGTSLMGLAGAFLAIPFISFLIVIFKSLENRQ